MSEEMYDVSQAIALWFFFPKGFVERLGDPLT
jgi:hypothetical protein